MALRGDNNSREHVLYIPDMHYDTLNPCHANSSPDIRLLPAHKLLKLQESHCKLNVIHEVVLRIEKVQALIL